MAKKLADIQKEVSSRSIQFFDFFYSNINSEIKSFISELMLHTNVFVFSGVIRDFFVFKDNVSFRDVDLIIESDIVLENLFPNLKYKKNSYGGYKLQFLDLTVDVWVVKNTWALNNGQLKFEFDYLHELPNTTFFNFSSILYSLNNNKFIIGIDFLRFLRDKEIELVLNENPYPELCIVNSFYYNDKLKFKIGDKLKDYLKRNFVLYKSSIESIQCKHFGKIVYTQNLIEKRIGEI